MQASAWFLHSRFDDMHKEGSDTQTLPPMLSQVRDFESKNTDSAELRKGLDGTVEVQYATACTPSQNEQGLVSNVERARAFVQRIVPRTIIHRLHTACWPLKVVCLLLLVVEKF